jgi:tRNA (adenine22-N1)-methyltransferase
VTKQNLRLNAICDLVSQRIIADVGSDHGFVPKILLQEGKIDFAYVTDISEKCVLKAKENLRDFFDKTQFVVCDGLMGLLSVAPRPQQIVIAGMGGWEIIKILSQDKLKNFGNFILQPQKNVEELRIFLQNNFFEIKEDFLLREGKIFYNILYVCRSKTLKNLTNDQILFGKTNLSMPNDDFMNFLNQKIDKFTSILQETTDGEIQNLLKRFVHCREKCQKKILAVDQKEK